jgi:hypothetical protein
MTVVRRLAGPGGEIMGQESSDTKPLPLPLLRRVDEVCRHFEDRWLAGERPDLEAFLTTFAEAERPVLLPQLLLLEWDYRVRRGESFFFEEYGSRFPALHPVVEQAWKRWCKEREQRGGPAAFPPPSTGEPGEPVEVAPPDHEQVTPLGKGGMGEVFKAFDPRLKRWVALKQVRLDQPTPGWLARFRLEAEALAKLQHPHIVAVHAFTEQAGGPLLVLEYVAGGTLEERLKGPLPAAEAARLVAILAWALQAAHDRGITHRDLKPANVLMAEAVPGNSGNVLGGFPKIADFGLASLADQGTGQTITGEVFGTPAYMSPEQAAGRMRQVGPATDVWALGVILYRCLTGQLPFVGDSVPDTLERIKTMRFRPVGELRPDLPEELARACMACLRKGPRRQADGGTTGGGARWLPGRRAAADP